MPSRYDERLARIDNSLEAARAALPPQGNIQDVALAQAYATLAVAEANRAIFDTLAEVLVQIESGRLDPSTS